MEEPTKERICSRCGAKVPDGAAEGWCTRCLLATAATASEGPGTTRSGWVPPELARVAAAFPHLEVVELIGVGGMGAVYRARQPKLDRWVALKLLPEGTGRDPAFGERFLREARVLARLSHPNIVGVHDFGQSGEFCYLLMEYVDGVNLRQAMRAGRFSPIQALALVPQICSALQFAHDAGVMHRDIKPENILLDSQGRVKLADFGIAKLLGEPTADPALTLTGTLVGTPQYMAPEQIEHPANVDHRADIYSLGVVFYELLTGELPLGRFAAPSAKTPLDARIDEIVLRALAKEREMRQQSADEVRTQIEGVSVGGSSKKSAPVTAPHSKGPMAPAADPGVAPILESSLGYRRAVFGLIWAFVAMIPFLFGTAVTFVSQQIRYLWSGAPVREIAGVLMGLLVCGLGCWFLMRRLPLWWMPVFRLSHRGDEPLNRGIGVGLMLALLGGVLAIGLGVFGSVIPLVSRWFQQGSGLYHLTTAVGLVSLPWILILGWRRGSRAATQGGLAPSGALPRWAEWVALSMLLLAVLTNVAVVMRRSEGTMMLVGGGEFAISVCLAWWTRSRFWRGMAQVISAYTVVISIIAVGAWVYWLVSGPSPILLGETPPAQEYGGSCAVLLSILGSGILHGLSWFSFWPDKARRVFGMPERRATSLVGANVASNRPA